MFFVHFNEMAGVQSGLQPYFKNLLRNALIEVDEYTSHNNSL